MKKNSSLKHMPMDLYENLLLHEFSKEIQVKKSMNGLVWGNFGACNFGDEAILAGQIKELYNISNMSLTVISRFPLHVEYLHNLQSLPMFSIAKIIYKTIKSDLIIIGGGGIICKNDGGIWSLIYQLYMFIFSSLLPVICKKDIYVLGIGFYTNAHPLIKKLYVSFFKHVKVLTVRDQISFDVLSKYSLPVRLFKDSSFHMNLMKKESIKHNPYFDALYRSSRKHVGISLKKPSNPEDESRLLNVISEFITKNQHDTDFWFYSLDYHPRYENDKLFGQKLYAILQEKQNEAVQFHFIPVTLRVCELFSSFQLMDFMITMRLHSSIFSYRQQIPFIGISYDEKCTSFLKSIGKDILHSNSLHINDVQREYEKCLNKSKRVKKIVKMSVGKVKFSSEESSNVSISGDIYGN